MGGESEDGLNNVREADFALMTDSVVWRDELGQRLFLGDAFLVTLRGEGAQTLPRHPPCGKARHLFHLLHPELPSLARGEPRSQLHPTNGVTADNDSTPWFSHLMASKPLLHERVLRILSKVNMFQKALRMSPVSKSSVSLNIPEAYDIMAKNAFI